MYVVAGATGNTGSVVAESLLAQGRPVTVLVRSEEKGRAWAAKGAKIGVGTLEDSESLTRILTGAEGAYLLTPPNFSAPDFLTERKSIAASIARAVRDSGIPHVVLLSSIGAQHASGTGPIVSAYIGEAALQDATKNVTFIRAAYFLENWAPILPAAKENGILPTLLIPDRKIPMVGTRDIGQVAAESLLNPARGRRVIELAGPREYSAEDIAAILSTLLHRDVRLQAIPLSAGLETFKSLGFSEALARLFQEMYAGINSGLVDYERQGAEFRRGTVTAEQALRGMLGQATRAGA
jgi:uncharacterized protein YbjT (DUF2867 family)